MLRKAIRLGTRVQDYVETVHKNEGCMADQGARLHPESRIWNFQNNRRAIAVGRLTHVRGELLVFAHCGEIQIGQASYIGEDSRIWSAASIAIGNRVLISHGVNIHDNNAHSLSAAARHAHFIQIISSGHPAVLNEVASAPILIEDDVWIGFNATILKGVTIGKGAIVGAASVVTKSIPPYVIVAGSPARQVGIARP